MKTILKIFLSFFVCIFILSACGDANETPEQVMENFKQKITEVKSGDVSATIVMKGSDGTGNIDFKANADLQFDRRDSENRKFGMNIVTDGIMNTDGKSLNANADFSVRTIAENYYIRLDKLESTDEDVAKILPLIKLYQEKWLHISSDFIPEDVRKLQQKDEETLAKEQQLKDLFIKTSLFSVVKEYGIENVDGNKVYHYGIQPSADGIKEYIREAAIIDGRELTDAEIEDASKIASYVKNAEIWIGIKDYYLYKAALSLDGGDIPEDASVSADITVKFSDYNEDIQIDEPVDAQEFNPLELIMSYGAMNMEEGETGEGMEEDQLSETETEEEISEDDLINQMVDDEIEANSGS